MLKKGIAAFVGMLLFSGLYAQVHVRITLKDDDVISGTIQMTKVNLVTDFGKLEIPAKNVSGIRLAVKSEEDETAKSFDVVEIDNTYSMAGQTNIKSIDVKTEYGTLNVPTEKIEHMDMYTLIDGQAVFKLHASKHISSNPDGGWLNTGIMLKKGDNFTITANGQVVFASLSGAKYTPDGKTGDSAASAYDYGTAQEGGQNYNSYPSYGNVVYKIGEKGMALKAGDKFSGTANDYGLLYISIYEVVYNQQNTGSYIVKVERK